MDRRKTAIRVGVGAAVLLLLWIVFAYGLAPRLIRSAYSGDSVPFLNDLFQGRSRTPLERYQAFWSGLALRGTVAAGVLGLAAVLLVRFGDRVAALRRAWFQAEPTVSWAGAVLQAAAVGSVLGAVEVALRTLKYRYDRVFFEWSNPDLVWMIPTSQAAFFAALAVGYLLVTAWPARRVSIQPLLAVLVAIGGWGILISMKQLGIHSLASGVLALGLGVQAAKAFARAPARSARQLGVAGALVGVLSLGGMVGLRPGSAVGPQGSAAASGRAVPNVLLLVLDTVRAQSLGLYGYPRPTTPRLEAFAERGVVFDRAFSTAPWTLPSHSSLFTGRWHHEMSANWLEPLDARYPTLAEFLSGHGYETGGFVANLLYTTRITGLDRGFRTYRDHQRTFETWIYSAAAVQKAMNRLRALVPGGWLLFERKLATDVNDEFLTWVDGLDGRPFFGFLNYFDAHEPYERFEPQLSQIREVPRDSIATAPGQTRALTREEREAVDRYDGSIRYLDDAIGGLLDALETRGLLDETLIVVTADHGDQFFEHGLEGHSNSLYQMLTRVPLLMVLPGRVPAGLRVHETVSIRDVPSTIADVLGLAGPAPFAGTTLRRTWDPESGWSARAAALTEVDPYPLSDFDGPVVRGPMKAVASGDLYYIRNGDGVEELYDLVSDPWQLSDLIGTPRGAQALPGLRADLRDATVSGHFTPLEGHLAPTEDAPGGS
ncbi:MAG: sulfatase [Gemmatimonadetes bacterium]|nr:sulfatase [Gemmatimonadota bacterium]